MAYLCSVMKEDENNTVVLEVEGMTCTNCAQGVTRTLENAGLKQVHVDFASGEVVYAEQGVLPIDADCF